MTEILIKETDTPLDKQYQLLIKQMRNLLNKEEKLISNLANASAALKETFDKISWVGFYLYDGGNLYLGPFQGKVACTRIELGKGVCGTSAKEKKSIVVPDVNKFPGHIFCDVDSRSEIVIPILKEGNLLGVLDIDSTSFNSFDDTDRIYLEEICNFLSIEIFS